MGLDDSIGTRRNRKNRREFEFFSICRYSSKFILPAAEALFGPGRVLLFVQDRSPVHTSQYTKRWLQNNSIIDVINWPAKAADLNPIENLWARMAADCNFHQAGTTDDIWNTIQQQWNSFRESNYCEILINSSPRRLEDVIANGGFWTKY